MQRIPIIVFLLLLLIAFPAWADINSDLVWAVLRGDTATVQTLLDTGADVNAKEDEKGYTALIFATKMGNAEIVQALLDRDAEDLI